MLLVVLIGTTLGLAGGYHAFTHFAMNTDTAALISADLPWRQGEIAYGKAFPQQEDLIAIVIDGRTPELAERAAALLSDRLSGRTNLFRTVRRPDGGPFFDRNGLMYLSTGEVQKTVDDLIRAQPFFGALALDPSLHGVMASLSTALVGVERNDARLADLARPIAAFGEALRAVVEGKPAFFSWRGMMTGEKPSLRETRRFVLVQPVLDYSALTPGAKATDAIREAALDLGLSAAHGVTVRLTGPVPLADEEFATLAEHAGLMLGVMTGLVVLMLWLAVRSLRIILCILATLMVGLAATAAFGLIAIGPFNPISVAFITLFVGLGVDFGIQFSVRYRAERYRHTGREAALVGAGRSVGHSLALAAAATAAGFYALVPTSYVGVSQLGLIAGTGMIIAFLLSITFLPALILLTGPGGKQIEMGYPFLAPLDDFLATHRRGILVATGILALACFVAVPFLRFDFNPLNLRSASTESVSTLLDLMGNPDTTPNTVNVLVPSIDAARALAARLSALPEVERTLTVESFVPDDQQHKLALISDASMLLGPTLDPFGGKPASSDAETVALIRTTATQLRHAAEAAQGAVADDARRLAATLDLLANARPELRATAAEVFVPGLQVLLAQLRSMLEAEPVSLSNLPPAIASEWVTGDGRFRVEAVPRGDSNDNATLRRFVAAVRAVAPEATGAPISIQEAGRTIEHAFFMAGIWSFLLVTLLLVAVLRRAKLVLLTLLPLLLAGLLTLATCVVIGQPLNFANIIALPLLFGIGVAFNIYYVMAWRAGVRGLVQSSLARAIFFSALTTASAFGSLWLSSHPGTASMGKLLIISLGWTLFCTLLIQPAVLGEPLNPSSALPKDRPASG